MDTKTVKEAAQFLNVSETTIYRLVRDGKLGCYGGHQKRKHFSVQKHLLPYLRSIEQLPEPEKETAGKIMADTEWERYEYKSGAFDGLLV